MNHKETDEGITSKIIYLKYFEMLMFKRSTIKEKLEQAIKKPIK